MGKRKALHGWTTQYQSSRADRLSKEDLDRVRAAKIANKIREMITKNHPKYHELDTYSLKTLMAIRNKLLMSSPIRSFQDS